MLLSLSHVSAREADRAMVEAAMEQFLAAGNQIKEVGTGVCADLGEGRERMSRIFTINSETKEERPKRYRTKKTGNAGNPDSLKKALASKNEALRKKREMLAVRIAAHVALGDSLSAIAKQLGVSRNHVKKVARENKITLNHNN
ncbi:hypothetical protein D3C76_47610 [compost metagenome]